jgi:hypothetical protein
MKGSNMSKFSDAVETVTKGIKDDPDLFFGYQSNIAMAFIDEYSRNEVHYKNKIIMHEIANNAAKNFLNMWVNYKQPSFKE